MLSTQLGQAYNRMRLKYAADKSTLQHYISKDRSTEMLLLGTGIRGLVGKKQLREALTFLDYLDIPKQI